MAYPRLLALLQEYDLEIDDIRWYLSVQMADEILTRQAEPKRLIEEIWSGQLADQLYDMEEKFLNQQEELWNTAQIDETRIREIFMEARAAKRRRWVRP